MKASSVLENGFDSEMHTILYAKGRCFLRDRLGARHVTYFSFDERTLRVDATFATILHGENFGGSTRPTRRTDAPNTRRAARPLFSRTALPIRGNHYPKLGELLRKMLGLAVLAQDLSLVWGNQCPNFRVDATLNQRGEAFPSLVQRFY